jgi:hypothetical protein
MSVCQFIDRLELEYRTVIDQHIESIGLAKTSEPGSNKDFLAGSRSKPDAKFVLVCQRSAQKAGKMLAIRHESRKMSCRTGTRTAWNIEGGDRT